MPNNKGKPHVKVNHLGFTLVVKAMFGKGATVVELQELTGISVRSLYSLVNMLHKHGVCYVSDREADRWGRYMTRRYALGNLPDKPKPAPRSRRKSD